MSYILIYIKIGLSYKFYESSNIRNEIVFLMKQIVNNCKKIITWQICHFGYKIF